MNALRMYAGPRALAHLHRQGLRPQDVALIPAAAGGPKGLILNPLDRFLFGDWLAETRHTVHLAGASIGAWRMAAAACSAPDAALARMASDYIGQTYRVPPGRRAPTPRTVSEGFGTMLEDFFAGRTQEVLTHPRYRLHVFTSRGRHLLQREGPVRTALGYAAAIVANAVARGALGSFLERVVFSAGDKPLPVPLDDFPHRLAALTADNLVPALRASCSIPFVLQAVQDIPHAPSGAYWDGGITDYHLHLDYRPVPGIVLYPHFQRTLIPGWLDKPHRRRHAPTARLDNVLVLAPDPDWVRTLPGGKLPDRSDFQRYGTDTAARRAAWERAVGEAQRLADEFSAWLQTPDPARVESL